MIKDILGFIIIGIREVFEQSKYLKKLFEPGDCRDMILGVIITMLTTLIFLIIIILKWLGVIIVAIFSFYIFGVYMHKNKNKTVIQNRYDR